MIDLHRWFTGLMMLLPSAGVISAQAEEPEPPAALVVAVEGSISTKTVALVNRGIREVESLGARYLILQISSRGGPIDQMKKVREELRRLKNKDIATVAYVDGFANSAAALIAITCNQTFMKTGSELGTITPVQYNPLTGEMDDIPTDARRKHISSIQTMLHAAIEGTPRDNATVRLLLNAMVDPGIALFEVAFRDESGIEQTNVVVDKAELERMQETKDITFSVPPRALKRPLTLTPGEAVQFGLAEGIVDSLNDVVERELLLEMSQVARMSETWSENLAAFLNDMRSVLFVLGFILLLIELKTPGFALPGILGVIMFGLAFFGAYTVGLADIGEILLFFLGLGLVATEIFFFPGTIIFGVLGFIAIVSGLILSQQDFIIPATQSDSDLMLTNFANFGLILVVVMSLIWVIYANIHRIPLLRAAVQTPPEAHEAGTRLLDAADERRAQLLWHTGELATDLRPTGWMDVGDERFDVVSEGDFIPKGSRVRVIEVRGNRVVVEVLDDDSVRGDVTIPVLIMLVLIGLALVVAEVFFVSFGVLAILSGVSLVSAVFLAFAHHEAWVGWTFLGASAIGVPVTVWGAFKLLPYTPMGRQFYLSARPNEEVTGGAQEDGLATFLHKSGVALCDLRPAGFAQIDGRRVDVITRGEMLEKDCPLKVIKVETNQVVVTRDAQSS